MINKKFKLLTINELKALAHPTRVEILRRLAKKPLYTKKLAKELNINEQRLYYHISILKREGLVKTVRKIHRKGIETKFLAPTSKTYILFLSEQPEQGLIHNQVEDKQTPFPLNYFITQGKVDVDVVVGSPDLHGKYGHRAKDAYLAAQVTYLLGLFSTRLSPISIYMDVDYRVEISEIERSLILIGGPISNMLTDKINSLLPVFFDVANHRVSSSLTNKNYTDEAVGVLEKIQNPYNERYALLLIAGLSLHGTKTALLALQNLTLGKKEEVQVNTSTNYAAVFLGKDMDSDGEIDNYDVLEETFF